MKQGLLATLFFLLLSISSFGISGTSLERAIKVDATLAKHSLWTAKAEFLVEAPPNKVWRVVLEDIDDWDQFIPRILYSQILSEESAKKVIRLENRDWAQVVKIAEGENYPLRERIVKQGPHQWTYHKLLLMDLPWPVKNRWALQKEIDRFDPSTKSYSRRFILEKGNLVVAEGYWRARPHPENPNWSLVYYENSYDPGFQVPEFIFKPLVRNETRKILEAVRERAEGFVTGGSRLDI